MSNMTAAERYAEAKESQFETFLNQSFSDEALNGVQLYEHKVPSGITFKVRNIDLAFYTAIGSMPVSLMEALLDSQIEGQEKPAEALSPQQMRANIQTNAQMVRYMCVEPRLVVGEVNGQKNAISFGALTMTDFGSLVTRAREGGESPGLKTFRSKRK